MQCHRSSQPAMQSSGQDPRCVCRLTTDHGWTIHVCFAHHHVASCVAYKLSNERLYSNHGSFDMIRHRASGTKWSAPRLTAVLLCCCSQECSFSRGQTPEVPGALGRSWALLRFLAWFSGTVTLPRRASSSVSDLKSAIASATGMGATEQQLAFGSVALLSGSQTLDSVGIESGDHLLISRYM